MPFMGDSRRRQLRRLSTRSTTSTKTDGSNSDSTPNTPKTSKPSKRSSTKQASVKAFPVPPKSVPLSPRKDAVDVFAFMEEDEQGIDIPQREHAVEDVPDLSSSPESSSSTSSRPRLQSPYSDLEVHAGKNRLGYLWPDNSHKGEDSMHSDSGISMLSSCPTEESPVLGYKSRFATFENSTPTASHYRAADSFGSTSALEVSSPQINQAPSIDVRYVEEPEMYYASSPAVPMRTPITADFHAPHGLQPTLAPSPYGSSHGSMHMQRSPMPDMKKSGYDLLASSIGFQNDALLTPIYRKFETLNNRILLYLQDEISEMEESLKGLDSAIAREEGHRMASRRSDPMYPSQLKWHRQELMCRIFSKVEQYSKPVPIYYGPRTNGMVDLALSSYSKLATSLQPASHSNIDAYRAWIAEHAPLVEQETDFLHNESDLLTISRNNTQAPKNPDTTPMVMVAVVLVSTIVVFKVVPQLLARLVISAVVGVGGLCTLAPKIMEDVTMVKEWKWAAGM